METAEPAKYTEEASTEVKTEKEEIEIENTEGYESCRLGGFVEQNGNTYYYVNGVPVIGFQTNKGKTYYFEPKTSAMQTGYLHLGRYSSAGK